MELGVNYGVPSPQANNLRRVLILLEGIHEGKLDKDNWLSEYNFHPRQWFYHFDALRWLKLIQGSPSSPGGWVISAVGFKVIEAEFLHEKLMIVKPILMEDPVFSDCLNTPGMAIDHIGSKILDTPGWGIRKMSTAKRRAGTVRSWCNEIMMSDELE